MTEPEVRVVPSSAQPSGGGAGGADADEIDPARLREIEASFHRLTQQLRQAETDYLELLEQTDVDRAQAEAEVAAARDTAAHIAAEAARVLERAEQDARRLRQQAGDEVRDIAAEARATVEELRAEEQQLRSSLQSLRDAEASISTAATEAAAERRRAANDAADAAAMREVAEQELADAAARQEQIARDLDEVTALRAQADRERAEAAALRERTEQELAELQAQRERTDRDLAVAMARRAEVDDDLTEAITRRDRAAQEASDLLDEAQAARRRAIAEAERIRAEAAAEAAVVHAEADEAIAALARVRSDHDELRHSLGVLPRRPDGDRGAEPPEHVGPAPVYIPPRLVVFALALVLVCALGAYMVASLGDKVYGGRVEILVDVPSASSTAERQMATQRVLIESQVVMGAVAEDEGVPVDEVERSLSVQVVGASEVLRVTVGDEDPEVARDRAQAIADAYIALIDDVSPTSASDIASDTATPTDARLIAPARLLDDPIAPRPLRAAAGGAMAGMFVGGAILGIHVLLQRWRRSTPLAAAT